MPRVWMGSSDQGICDQILRETVALGASSGLGGKGWAPPLMSDKAQPRLITTHEMVG